ncbi:6-phosphogluconolactonase [Paenibacillus solanacearum]|uniref:6-phosphogluconolactonase n=1 Tax=Paenibacillus solanacearum TaxID=2048548 RepID=A0A916K772_9BACL|nr:lactonase family protein [Paenibacillus solanacearum]CAG7642552.1 6-phosphogluconolactonase [Paenibacillus solanacearum]
MPQHQSGEYQVYIGSYAPETAAGIYQFALRRESGELQRKRELTGVENPSFLEVNPEETRLYAVSETGQGKVVGIAIEPSDGLRILDGQPTLGGAPCHLRLCGDDRLLVVANYNGGNIVLYPIEADGGIGPLACEIKHTGSSVNPERQERPHPHSVFPDPSGHFVLVPDLGTDQIMVYRLDRAARKLSLHREVAARSGSGPRHLAFHPAGDALYVIHELDSTVTSYTYDAASGELKEQDTCSTLPADYNGWNGCAEIKVSPCGRYLYASNRGHDSIAVFAIAEDRVLLTATQHVSSGGKTPRNFALTPDGAYLIAANQDSDTIVTFAVDPDTGKLTETARETGVPKPVCIRVAAQEK